jgi:hypothetical protein
MKVKDLKEYLQTKNDDEEVLIFNSSYGDEYTKGEIELIRAESDLIKNEYNEYKLKTSDKPKSENKLDKWKDKKITKPTKVGFKFIKKEYKK